MELAKRLHRHGHRISVAGPSVERPVDTPEGVDFIALDDYRLGGPTPGSPSFIEKVSRSARQARLDDLASRVPVGQIREILRKGSFDHVFVDCELHPHTIAALAEGHRVAQVSDVFIGPAGLSCPPLSSATVPRKGHLASKLQVGLNWLSLWSRTVWLNMRSSIASGGTSYREVLGHIARSLRVDLSEHTTTLRWLRPFEWNKIPTIILQASELDFPRPRSRQTIYVGPLLPETETSEGPDHEALSLAQSARASGKTVIYIGFGSIMAHRSDLVEAIWGVISRETNWIAIHSLGGREQHDLPEPPKNVHVFSWLPQRRLLDHVDLSINHAGVGTIVECIDAQVPMLCLPQTNDQPGCAARVEYHGLGHLLRPDADADAINAVLQRLVKNSGYRRRCREMRKCFDDHRTNAVAERAIDALLSRHE